LKKSILLKVIAGGKYRWILKGLWISAVIGGDAIEPDCRVADRKQRQMPELERAHVAVHLAGNK
jgi:hypothetical protein